MLAQLLDDPPAPAVATRQPPVQLVVALTGSGQQAQVIYVGQLHGEQVIPLVWKVLPGQARWERGLWAEIRELFERLAPQLEGADCTVIGDQPFGCFPMVRLCQEFGWHYLLQVSGQHTCAPRWPDGHFSPPVPLSQLLAYPGASFYGPVRLWRDRPVETQLSGGWEPEEKQALRVISDRPAGAERVTEYRLWLRVAVAVQDPAGGGCWNWGQSQVSRVEFPGAAVGWAPASAADPLVDLSTVDVAAVAARETQKFLKHVPFDDRYGFELFRRAVEEGDQLAWHYIYAQYASLVLSWLNQDPRSAALFQRDEGLVDSLINAAFARFAHAVTPLKLRDFNQLAGLLGYLKLCARCAVHDEVRVWRTQHKLEAAGATLEDLEESAQDPSVPDPAEEVMGSAFSKRLWRLLQYEFTSDDEQIVIYLSFYFSMRPAEIAREYPQRFPTPADVSRIKRNVMERLRRDLHLQAAIRRLIAA